MKMHQSDKQSCMTLMMETEKIPEMLDLNPTTTRMFTLDHFSAG
jgi:hypothetical protein